MSKSTHSLMKHPAYPWVVWGLGAAFFLTEYFIRMAPGVMGTEIMQAFHVDALGYGTLSACFYYGYLPMQVPVGALVDRFGAHRLLLIMCLLCALSSFAFAGVDALHWAQVFRFLMGFSSAFAFVGTLKLAQLWFSSRRFGLLAGCTQALGMLGAAIGAGPVAALVESLGWRETMVVLGSSVMLIALLIALLVREHPKAEVVAENRSGSMADIWQGLWVVLRNRQSWINALFAGLIYSPTAAFAELWGPTYLTEVQGLHHVVAASAVSMIFLGWAVGGPVNGYLADRMGRRKPSLYGSALMSFVFLTTALYWPHLSAPAVFVCLFLFGFSNTGLVNAYAISGEINPGPISGISMAFCNMVSVLLGALLQPIIGWCLNRQWAGAMVDGVKHYPAHAYQMAMLVLPICLFLSWFVALWVKETYCRQQS